MSIGDEKTRIQHLSRRAGFGSDPALIYHHKGSKKWSRFLKETISGSKKKPAPITVSETPEFTRMIQMRGKKLTPEERKNIRKKSREGMKNLNLAWIDEMVSTKYPFREKMAFFWHGHFACRVNNVLHNQLMLDVIRQNALGNFKDLLFGISKSPAMLQFLNNQQNRQQHPNENFGREVMELFTMGRGNYTEKDVKEGSRAFTGWGFNRYGEFVFRPRVHDNGIKTFLGKTGNFNGDDILNIILEQKATAHHVTHKIYRFFVNDIPDETIVHELADKFYESNYNIASLMGSLFKSDDFYHRQNMGNLIKSPVELLVGMRRTIPVDFGKDKVQLPFQRLMDQVLFYPPNVGGWPGGRSWIDSSTLLFRMRLPQAIYYSKEITLRPKDMPDEMTNSYSDRNMSGQFVRNFAKRVNASVSWKDYLDSFRDVPDSRLPDAIADSLLACKQKILPELPLRQTGNKQFLNQYTDHTSRENYIKSLTIDLMSTPEYQLC